MGDVIKQCSSCSREFKTETDFLTKTSRWRKCNRGNLWFNCECNSTLMLPSGKFEWYSPEKTMSEGAAAVFNRISNLEKLPKIPSSFMEIQQLIDDQKSTAQDIEKALKKDPGIALETPEIAKNVKQSRTPGEPITSLQHAVSYLGRKYIGEIVVTSAIKKVRVDVKEFNVKDFWLQSLLTGAIAEILAPKIARHLPRDEIYLAGCLCNLGKIVMAVVNPEALDKTCIDMRDPAKSGPWPKVEQRYTDIDHAVLGEIAAALWGLPNYIATANRYHHKLPEEAAGSRYVNLPEFVNFSNQMTHWLLLQPERIDGEAFTLLKKKLDLSEKDVDSMADYLRPIHDKIMAPEAA